MDGFGETARFHIPTVGISSWTCPSPSNSIAKLNEPFQVHASPHRYRGLLVACGGWDVGDLNRELIAKNNFVYLSKSSEIDRRIPYKCPRILERVMRRTSQLKQPFYYCPFSSNK